jgi:hypothetical protein
MTFVAWAAGRLPEYRPTPADLAALALGMHHDEAPPNRAVRS